MSKREYLTVDEVKAFLAAIWRTSRNPERDYCLVVVIIHYRLKVSKALSLPLRDIVLESKKLYIAGLEGFGEHAFYDVSAALKDWLGKRKEMNPPKRCDTIFISERRRPMSRGAVNLLIKIAAKEADLDHLSIRPEILRHVKTGRLDSAPRSQLRLSAHQSLA